MVLPLATRYRHRVPIHILLVNKCIVRPYWVQRKKDMVPALQALQFLRRQDESIQSEQSKATQVSTVWKKPYAF